MATKRWVGNAIAVAQADLITIALTWATSDTCTVTINGKSLVLTVGASTAVGDVATGIKEMINGDAATTGCTFSETGDNVAEFQALTATVSTGVVTVTADTAGKPFTMTITGDGTAGDGTAVRSASVACTGPYHFDNANNWSGGVAPVGGDTIVYDSGSIDCLYALATGLELNVEVTMGFTGKIGLAEVNVDNSSFPYSEYLEKYLVLTKDGGGTTVKIGDGDGNGSRRIRIDMNDMDDATVTVYNSGTPESTSVPAVFIKGGGGSTLNLKKGNIGVAYYAGESADFDTVYVSYVSSATSDVTAYFGSGAALSDATYLQTGGTVEVNASNTTGTVTLNAGVMTITGSGAQATIMLNGGTMYYNSSGTITTLGVGDGGIVDFTRDNASKTVSNANMYKGSTLLDSNKVVTYSAGIDLEGCSLSDVTLDIGSHVTVTPSAI